MGGGRREAGGCSGVRLGMRWLFPFVVLISCRPTGLSGTMTYTATDADGSIVCSVLMDMASTKAETDCPSCRFRFDVDVTAIGGIATTDCMGAIPYFYRTPDDPGNRDGFAIFQSRHDVLTFTDYPGWYYEYGYYDHPYTYSNAPAHQRMGPGHPATTYLRSGTALTFGYARSYDADTTGTGTITLTGTATLR